MAAPPPAVTEELAQLPRGSGQQAFGEPSISLNLKKLSKPPGAWRLRTGDWRSIFFQTGDDFLVAAVGLRQAHAGRADRLRPQPCRAGMTVTEATCAAGTQVARSR